MVRVMAAEMNSSAAADGANPSENTGNTVHEEVSGNIGNTGKSAPGLGPIEPMEVELGPIPEHGGDRESRESATNDIKLPNLPAMLTVYSGANMAVIH